MEWMALMILARASVCMCLHMWYVFQVCALLSTLMKANWFRLRSRSEVPKRARKKKGANVRKERLSAPKDRGKLYNRRKNRRKGLDQQKTRTTSGTSNTLSTSTIISTTSSSPTTTGTIATAPAGAILPLLLLCYLLRKWKPAIGTPPPRTFTAWARWLRSFSPRALPLGGCRGPGPPRRRAPQRWRRGGHGGQTATRTRLPQRPANENAAESRKRKILSPAKRIQSQRPREGGCRWAREEEGHKESTDGWSKSWCCCATVEGHKTTKEEWFKSWCCCGRKKWSKSWCSQEEGGQE